MLSGGDHVLVAVSGGADSTALLLCLHALASEFHLTLSVAHLNHGIRRAEADSDEDFVGRMCADLGLRFISETVDIKHQAKAAGRNIEDLARQKRYEFLRRCAREIGAQKIAVGHTLNDQAETALFRFIRGSGIEGLSSIHPVLGRTVIRPLIECSRASILKYLKERGSSYRDDSTNRDLKRARNRIRLELIPYLESHFNPRTIETLAREADLVREAWTFIESQAKDCFQKIHARTADSITLNIKDFSTIHPTLRKEVCRQTLLEFLGSLRGITSRHIDGLMALSRKGQSGSLIQLPHGCTALRRLRPSPAWPPDPDRRRGRFLRPVRPLTEQKRIPRARCRIMQVARVRPVRPAACFGRPVPVPFPRGHVLVADVHSHADFAARPSVTDQLDERFRRHRIPAAGIHLRQILTKVVGQDELLGAPVGRVFDASHQSLLDQSTRDRDEIQTELDEVYRALDKLKT